MVKHGDYFEAEKGKHFVLTERGKKWASYKNYKVGEPIEEDDRWTLAVLIEEGVLIEVDDPDWTTMKGYKVVRDYKGTQLPCGNHHTFYSKEMAERYRENYENLYKSWGKDSKPYIIDAIYEGKQPKPNKKYKGKTLFVEHNWWGEIGKIGDLVEGKIAMWFAECVPPRTFTKSMIQCGEPDSSSNEGTLYATFVKIDEDVWEYKGSCLAGHTEQDWTPIPFVL